MAALAAQMSGLNRKETIQYLTEATNIYLNYLK